VNIQAPKNSGSNNFNYKGHFSTVMMAVVDAHLRFRLLTVGSYGRESDAGIYSSSGLADAIDRNTLKIPDDRRIICPMSETAVPYVFISDEGFPLKERNLRPYPGLAQQVLPKERRIYNYRLSRARRTVESAFGLLAARWRVFHRRINASEEKVDNIIKASVVLHNFLSSANTRNRNATTLALDPTAITDIEALGPSLSAGRCRAGADAVSIREAFMQYFNSPDGYHDCPWQEASIGLK
jgi:hypothetical protein